jgi:hypothetical protein
MKSSKWLLGVFVAFMLIIIVLSGVKMARGLVCPGQICAPLTNCNSDEACNSTPPCGNAVNTNNNNNGSVAYDCIPPNPANSNDKCTETNNICCLEIDSCSPVGTGTCNINNGTIQKAVYGYANCH